MMAGSLSSPQTQCLESFAKHTRADMKELLTKRNNFVAIGCLIADTPQNDGVVVGSGPVGWQHTYGVGHHLGEPLRLLISAGWLTVELLTRGSSTSIYRVWVLPGDVGRAHIDRENQRLRAAFWHVLQHIDVSPDVWNGNHDPERPRCCFDLWATPVNASLFYLFNMLPSPAPSKEAFCSTKDKYVYEAMEDLLDGKWFTGLETTLYPYQRRSAALMLQREEQTQLQLDPRIEQRTAPDGRTFYYNARDVLFFKEPLFYESCRGGILAETMGLGKTLICLSLIISTRHHFPKMPSDAMLTTSRTSVASLQDIAIANIQRKSMPWQVELERIRHYNQTDDKSIREKLAAAPATYEVPVLPSRWNRNTVLPPPKRLTLAATTIVVVPRNLCKQWHLEIQKHVSQDVLRVLVMEDLRAELPQSDELRKYDLVLFSRSRFELEVRDGADAEGRRAPPAHTPLVSTLR